MPFLALYFKNLEGDLITSRITIKLKVDNKNSSSVIRFKSDVSLVFWKTDIFVHNLGDRYMTFCFTVF